MKTKINKRLYFLAAFLFFAIIFAVLFFAVNNKSVTVNAHASSTENALSQMSESECLDFIVDNGVEIPEER